MNQGVMHQMMRYGIVGGVVYLSDFAVFAAILWFVPDAYLVANVIGKVTGALVGFVLHRNFTFSWEQKDKTSRQAASYFLLLATNLIISSLLMWLLVDTMGANAFVAKLFVDIVVIATSFVAGRLWVYRPA
jgi:putative flippase GtrA